MQLYNPSQVFDTEDDQNRELMLKAFGKNIKNLRTKKGLTQEQLAERAGINGKYLGEIERGEKCPSSITVYRIAKALGTSVSQILDDCPRIDKGLLKEIEKLCIGKKRKDIEKAIRILQVFFE
jgi:transcriptional regulator with XRE-family HTH domain